MIVIAEELNSNNSSEASERLTCELLVGPGSISRFVPYPPESSAGRRHPPVTVSRTLNIRKEAEWKTHGMLGGTTGRR